MDLFRKLHSKARQIARESLDVLGVTLPPAHEDDTPRDVFEAYRRLVEKNIPEHAVAFPVPEAMRGALLDDATALIGNDEEAKSQLQSWIEDRKSLYPDLDNAQCTREMAQRECDEILRRHGLLMDQGESVDDWVATLQNIARSQKIPIANLIFQASRQVECHAFPDWIAEMNARLERFHYEIAHFERGEKSEVGIRTLKFISK